jgi:ATP-dependent RNA helicase DDX18/HAS1
MLIKSYNIINFENIVRKSKLKIDKWLYWLKKKNILTKHTFDIISFSGSTLFRLIEFNFTHMTKIQSIGIPFQLSGFDILGSAQTGSGKTLAFAVPIIEFIYTVKWSSNNGTAAIVISPTRELTIQTYHVFRDLLHYHNHSHGIIMGGANRKTEIEKLKKGQEILITTPGRLLDHLKSTMEFKFNNLQQIIVDEADRCLEVGFEEELNEIFKILPKKKQTIMFTATQDKQATIISSFSFKKKPIYINIENDMSVNMFKNIIHGFNVCQIEDKLSVLITLIKRNMKKKMIIFFSSCNEVKFYYSIFKLLNIEIIELHGKQKQSKRISAFFSFCRSNNSILFSTDLASRGLDIPAVDWIVQFSPPLDPKEYIHRAGRTGRGVNGIGKAIIFLLPSEIGFLKYLKKEKLEMNEFKFPKFGALQIRMKIENLVKKNLYLEKLSKDALKSFIHSYNNYSMKEIFDLKKINKSLLFKSFGISNLKKTTF